MIKLKRIVSGVVALCLMSLSCLPVSVSAEQVTGVNQSVINSQVDENLYQRVLALGFTEKEALEIVNTLPENVIETYLTCEIPGFTSSENTRSTRETNDSVINVSLQHATDTNVTGWNNDNSCGSVASAILLKYYKDYQGNKVILSDYPTTWSIYNDIKPYIEIYRTSSISSLSSGISYFLNDCGEPHTVSKKALGDFDDNETMLRSMLMTLNMYLSTDKPVLAGGNYPGRGGHVVVIQGMDTETVNGKLVKFKVTVNTGWGSPNAIQTIDFIPFMTVVNNSSNGIVYLFP